MVKNVPPVQAGGKPRRPIEVRLNLLVTTGRPIFDPDPDQQDATRGRIRLGVEAWIL